MIELWSNHLVTFLLFDYCSKSRKHEITRLQLHSTNQPTRPDEANDDLVVKLFCELLGSAFLRTPHLQIFIFFVYELRQFSTEIE